MALEPKSEDYRPFPNVQRRNFTQELLEVPAMVRALKLPRARRIMEVGCGRGVALPPLARLCAPIRLIGIDLDAGLLAEAAGRLAARGVNAELVLADVRHLPFISGSYDIVIDFGTCYHISNSEVALREIARVLDTGGMFAYETKANPLMSHPFRSFSRALPWDVVDYLRPHTSRILWSSRIKM